VLAVIYLLASHVDKVDNPILVDIQN
jgi:hypothetical protein